MALAGFVQGIVINVFLLLGFVALFSMVRDWPAERIRSIPAWANGLLFGATAIVAMLVPTSIGPGIIFDCRSGVIGTAALVGGPLCALASIPLPLIYRLHLGGSGLIPGLMEIILPALLGSICHRICSIGSRGLSVRFAVLSSLVVGMGANSLVVASILLFMPDAGLELSISSTIIVFLLVGPISMALFSIFLVLSRQNSENAAIHTSILQSAMDGYLLVDSHGRLREINETYCRMSRYSKPELLTKRISDIEASMNERQVADFIKNLAAKGGERFESSHRRKDGSIFDIEASIRYLPVAGGRFVSFVRDITERKKAQEALQESERKYKLLIETTNTGFVILDNEGKVIDANQEYLRMTGRSRLEDILGKNVIDWTAPHDLERNAEAVRECLRNGLIRNLEIDYLSAQGHIIPVEIQATVLSGGDPSQILSICRDITERRLAVKEKERLNLQLVQAQKMESVGRLAGGVAHDFNNMLGVILGWADMARLNLSPQDELYAILGNIMEAAQRSADLTRQLLAFARKQHVEPRIIDLNETIESMLKMLRRLIGEDIQLSWKPATGLEPVFIDPIQVHQILANLCINARDSIGHSIGEISIKTGVVDLDEEFCKTRIGATAGRYVMLAVRDNGCGMDNEILANVFEPFFTTKGTGKGTGLGLATVYGIVSQNKGCIDVSSQLGQGSTFYIYLPLYAAGTLDASRHAEVMGMLYGNETILLVEDEKDLLKAVQTMLNQLGYTILPAATPGEAIRLSAECAGPLHLLITDVVMPEMNGQELALKLREIRPDLKCLFISGYASEYLSHQSIPSEGTYYLQKPFLMNDLALKIKAILRSPAD
jgi:two-component system, cell cycle sensor histidine kinase and response regulator CckA